MTQATQPVPSKTPRVYGRFHKVKDGKWAAAEDVATPRCVDSVLQIVTECTISGDKIKVSPDTKVLRVSGKADEHGKATFELRRPASTVTSQEEAAPPQEKQANFKYLRAWNMQQGESPRSSSQQPHDCIPSFKPNKVPSTPSLSSKAHPKLRGGWINKELLYS